MDKRKIVIVVIVVAIMGFGFISMKLLASLKDEPIKKTVKELKRKVTTELVNYSDINSEITSTGRLSSQKYVDLSSEVQGKILQGSVALKKGQSFKRGQLLAKIYDKEAVLLLKAKKSRFLNSIANLLPDYKIDFKDRYKRWQQFFEEISIEKQLPEMPEIKESKEKIYLASRNILSDYYSIKSDELRLDKYRIYAPFNGSFTEVYAEVGAVVNPGSRIAKIIQTDKLELEVPVDISNVKWINKGDEVEILSDDKKNKWIGTVTRKSDFVDQNTQSVAIFIKISKKQGQELYKGMYLKARFKGVIVKNAMEIPRKAVFNRNKVFIVEDGKLKINEINILKINEKTLLFAGLPVNTKIVIEPLINATENTEVLTNN